MEIRVVRAEEYDELGRITVEAYRHLAGGTALGSYEDELLAVADRAADCVVLVAADDLGTLLGGVTYVPGAESAMSEFTEPDVAGIRMLAVRPRYQGSGVGRALTEACLARARAEGRRQVVLHSTPVMAVARAMYERLGFVASPDRDAWVTERPYSERRPLHLIAYVLTL